MRILSNEEISTVAGSAIIVRSGDDYPYMVEFKGPGTFSFNDMPETIGPKFNISVGDETYIELDGIKYYDSYVSQGNYSVTTSKSSIATIYFIHYYG